jgi:hypothetical protein
VTAPAADPTTELVFITGLHRSGTTLLHNLLRQHPGVSSLAATGMPHDEGQHLQAVLPTATDMGGPGRFARSTDAHLTAADLARYPDAGRRICQDWAPYWQGGGDRYVEKSPSSLLRPQFLKAVFPNSRFIILIRHPVAVSYATAKWTRQPLPALIRHWAGAYRTATTDAEALGPDYLLVRYEDVLRDPQPTLATLQRFLDLPVVTLDPASVAADGNARYLDRWSRRKALAAGLTAAHLRIFESACAPLGYNLF